MIVFSDRYEDRLAYMGSPNIDSPDEAKSRIILNSINVLMTRGRKGMYIYAADKKLRKKLLSLG
ncbi:DNA/RNA helicase domain-containing protein [Clostridium tyrobutyricum]